MLWQTVQKRWRAWLRAFHRDFGYLAIGFTVIYAVSGIAQNHIEDWGDVSYRTYETTKTIEPIAPSIPDTEAIARVAGLVTDFGTPTATTRARSRVRLAANGSTAGSPAPVALASERSVSMATAPFRNQGWSVLPQGGVR